ncbi:hypothetical protein [Acinetobacter gerneri]|uniref:hypothetical protein n=1 Tax=Acinetobacter gerneri TaxID=202952 RepID=UPI0028AA0798|nr:hypothetical protein [Acinetobacter gerneri]
MKNLIYILILAVSLAACSKSNETKKAADTQGKSDLSSEKNCKQLEYKDLIDQQEWNDTYQIFQIDKKDQLNTKSIIEYNQENFDVLLRVGQGNIGVPLEDNDLKLNSEYAIISKRGSDYVINLPNDYLSFKIKQNFNQDSNIQFKSPYDEQFTDLCTATFPQYIETIKFILFRSAAEIYMFQLKEQGDL